MNRDGVRQRHRCDEAKLTYAASLGWLAESRKECGE